MNSNSIEELGRQAAASVAGENAVQQVHVAAGEDDESRPVYYFSFLIDERRTNARMGLLRTRLVQRLRDDLLSQHDGHFPVITILNRDDWNRQTRAQSI